MSAVAARLSPVRTQHLEVDAYNGVAAQDHVNRRSNCVRAAYFLTIKPEEIEEISKLTESVRAQPTTRSTLVMHNLRVMGINDDSGSPGVLH
jgi:hypothetical protein